MNMVWLAILALVAGPGARSPAPGRADRSSSVHAGPASQRIGAPKAVAASRRPAHRPSGVPPAGTGLDDCDTEEGVDETWMLHLDALGAGAVARSDWARPRSALVAEARRGPAPRTPARIPLRC